MKRIILVVISLFIFTSFLQLNSRRERTHEDLAQTNQIIKILNNLPLYFVENRGQLNECVKYHLKIANGNAYFSSGEIVYQFLHKKNEGKGREKWLICKEKKIGEEVREENIHVRFLAANKGLKLEGIKEREAKFSYFRGENPRKWVKRVRSYHKVLYRELYPQIDLVVYGSEGRIKNEYRIRVGGEVEKIKLRYEGIKQLRVNEKGQLEIETAEGEIIEDKPYSYQIIDGKRVEVEAEYVIENDNTLIFKVGEFRKDRELIIDPDLIYSTYLGGSHYEHSGRGIAIDSPGCIYVTGYTESYTESSDFPTSPDAFDTSWNGDYDAFVTKLNSTGTDLIYSTFIGGSFYDYGHAIAVDANGNAYVTGETASRNFPTTPGAYDTSFDVYGTNAFVTKLNSSGTDLIYSTCLGGAWYDRGFAIAVDGNGNAYVTGYTGSTDFPTTPNAFDTNLLASWDAFVTKVNSAGTDLVYSTYLGDVGEDFGYGIAVGGDGCAYVTGVAGSEYFPTTPGAYDISYNSIEDAFVTKLNSTGTGLIYSTYLGGFGEDHGYGIAVDGDGCAYVTGKTRAEDFPTTPGAYDTSCNIQDVFVTKLNSSGTDLIYSTFLGGSADGECGYAIAFDESGNAYVTGVTPFPDFPTTPGAYDTIHNGLNDVFVTKLNSTGTDLIYSTYLGGSSDECGYGIAVDGSANIYVTGETDSSDFPTTLDAYDTSFNAKFGYETDVFISKIPCRVAQFSLTISTTSGGTTDPSPGTYTYDFGTDVTVKAVPNSGYQFSGWSGDASGTTNPITIAMEGDKSITANFASTSSGGGDGGGEKKGCFIATAAYGSSLHHHIDILRDFRDKYLMANESGRKIVDLYYKYSPFIADFIAKHRALKIAVRISLLPLIVFSYMMIH